MSVVTLLDVKVNNNPAMFGDPYQFEITFESLENLSKDLEWKLTYVGSAQSSVSHFPLSSHFADWLVAPNMTKNLTASSLGPSRRA
jgi:ASF1 like histone chaperone